MNFDEDAMVVVIQSPWKMYFDGLLHNVMEPSAGVVFVTRGEKFYHTLYFDTTKENKKADALGSSFSAYSVRSNTSNYLRQKWVVPRSQMRMKAKEAFNKTLCNLLKKVVSKSKRDWHERMEEALWAYRTTYRTPTQATPYSLAYGVEAVLPLERQIPSLRLAIQEGLTEEENARLRLAELEALDEKRLEAQQNLECYQARLSRAFNKKVRLRSFQVGDQVLAIRRPIIVSHKYGGKFTSKWDGPYVVQKHIQVALTSLLMRMA
ncbi:uncharacterized protein LOC132057546 [Lycium ferocissimum]|uniref:uncharacterized protein LOC132057546 n=1 Tax=Lycium ferocissimum TaxID=112874 RepID=UPI0028165432|nr:uncharacterized protein LOC132057546 [Lycium ferocissimum]